MKNPLIRTCIFVLGSALALTACSKKEEASITTRETEKAKEEIKDFKTDNSAAQKSEVELAFAQLDQEIRELEIRVEKTTGESKAEAAAKLEALKKRKSELQSDYTEAKFKALIEDIKNTLH